MSWTDKSALNAINAIRDFYHVERFVETGTYKGVNAQIQSHNFKIVETCDINQQFMRQAATRWSQDDSGGVIIKSVQPSHEFLKDIVNAYHSCKRKDKVIFYLDAHFYDPKGPRWVVQDELKALEGFRNAIVIIHDFDNGLGHCVYDGEHLGFNIVGDLLRKVNPNFHYYTNDLATCDIMKPNETNDPDMLDNLKYAWSEPRRTYRGILYCTPTKLPKKIGLKEWQKTYGTKLR